MASATEADLAEPPDIGWCSGEGTFHVDIPHKEKAPRTTDPDGSRLHENTPDLRGRTLQEVQIEASRIQKGQYFTSFEDFDRCLDSWAVLNGRGAAKTKTKANFCLRTCRFQRPPTSRSTEKPHSTQFTTCQEEANYTPVPILQSPCPIQNFGPQKNQIRNSGKENVDPNTVVGDNTGDINLKKSVLSDLSRNSNASGKFPGPCTTSSVCPELIHEPLQKQFVQHTSVWLPQSFPQKAAFSRVHTSERVPKLRKVSENGACGQLSRFIPVDPDQTNSMFGCPFRVRCQRLRSTGQCRITICELLHTCPQQKHKWRGPNQKAKWLAVTLAPRVVRNVQVPIAELLGGFKHDYKKSTSYKQMLRGKDLVRDWYLGGQRLSFHKIPALMQRIKEVDPEAVVDWSCQEGSSIFQRAFVCPSATQNALTHCQPVISLDACHSKNRKYPCQLFLATVLDGNSQVFILAYAVAPVENTDHWIWFLELLYDSIENVEKQHVPFVSDRQKGLLNAVRDVFPGKIHGHCANHLRQNVKKWFGKAAEHFFIGCVYATSKKLYDELLDRLERSVAKGAAAAQYIRKIDPKLYARHAFPLPRFGKVTSNPCEQVNAGLLPLREYAPFKLLHEMWFYMQQKFNERRKEALSRTERLTSQALRRFETNQRSFGQWEVLYDGDSTAKVQSTDHSKEYLVVIHPQFTCTCQELQEMRWPCEHIMAWDDQDGRDYNCHFAGCWKTEILQELYLPTMPCFLTSDLSTTTFCVPPAPAVKKGRHRVVRIQSGGRSDQRREGSSDEIRTSNGDLFIRYPIEDDPTVIDPMPSITNAEGLPRIAERPASLKRQSTSKKRSCKCSTCGHVGHNRRTCPTRQVNSIPQSQGVPYVQPEATDSFQSQEYCEDILTQPEPTEVPHYEESSGDDNNDSPDPNAANGADIYSSMGFELFGDGHFESLEEVHRILQLAEEGAQNVSWQMRSNTFDDSASL